MTLSPRLRGWTFPRDAHREFSLPREDSSHRGPLDWDLPGPFGLPGIGGLGQAGKEPRADRGPFPAILGGSRVWAGRLDSGSPQGVCLARPEKGPGRVPAQGRPRFWRAVSAPLLGPWGPISSQGWAVAAGGAQEPGVPRGGRKTAPPGQGFGRPQKGLARARMRGKEPPPGVRGNWAVGGKFLGTGIGPLVK